MKTLEQRFWSKVQKGAGHECWEWTAAKDSYGYGNIRVRTDKGLVWGRGWTTDRAHRVSWELHHGPPVGQVRHCCNSRSCVNPAHLFLKPDDVLAVGTNIKASFMAVLRNAFRATVLPDPDSPVRIIVKR